MANIPKKVEERLRVEVREFIKILETAKSRDINESDTVTIIKDMLAAVFGYDKYQEITSEYAIRGSYCDLAIKIKEKPHILIEVKAIGLELKGGHLRQAVDYAAKEGVDWVILTNGICWKLNKVVFSKPISHEFVFDIDFSRINLRDQSDIDHLFLLTKEAVDRDAIAAYHKVRQLKNKYILAAILTTEPSVNTVKRIFNGLTKEVRISEEEVLQILLNDIIKREIIEGDALKQASNTVKKLTQKRQAKLKNEMTDNPPLELIAEPDTGIPPSLNEA
jgi:hypothetical protein